MVLSKLTATAVLAFAFYKLSGFIFHWFTSPLRDLPGPKSSSLIYGNFKEIFNAENSVLHEKWAEEYGPTLKYAGFLNTHRVFTMDSKALKYILSRADDYQKPEAIRSNLSRLFGTGMLFVEGDQHRQQRKIMNPAFGPTQVRALTEIFVDKSIQLRDVWASEIANSDTGVARINVLSGLSNMTLDVIGLAGFNYKFNSLNPDEKQNELSQAFSTMFHAGQSLSILSMLQGRISVLRIFQTDRDRNIALAQKTMRRIGSELLSDAKQAVRESDSTEKRRDLLSLLVHANMASDVKEGQRLSDEDVLAQVPTFLVAGHETTSAAAIWALFALTQAPDVQAKLRAEIFQVSTETPTMDELNDLSYLDAVVRETLRIHAPVASTMRVAMRDDVIPLGRPFMDKKGVIRDAIKVSKGDTFFIPILAMNRSKAIWGDDAMEFKPERWASLPDAVSGMPGVWGNLLTFLAGPRACIGYRFSLVETKALLFTLVRAFEFELAVKPGDITKRSAIVQRPLVVSEPEKGNQMPLLIKPVNGA